MKMIVVILSLVIVSTMLAMAVVPEDYTVQVPAGWTKNQGSAAKEHYMKSGVSFILTVDAAPATAKNPDQFVEYVKKQLASTFKNTKFEPVKKITINGREGRELIYTGEISGIKMKYDVFYFARGTMYYTLTFGGMENMFTTVKPDIGAIVHSFKLK